MVKRDVVKRDMEERDMEERNVVGRDLPSPRARGGRSRVQAFCAWMRPRSGMQRRNCPRTYVRLHGHILGNRGPCSTFRRTFPNGRGGKK